jgi:hypothetical protein
MFSLIICSNNPARLAAVRAMYEIAFTGANWEFIHIPDAQSLTSGYNRGVAMAKGDILVFSHDDMEVLSPELPKRIESHLQKFDLIGVAGTSRLIAPAWFLAGYPYIFGQVAHPLPDGGGFSVAVYNAPDKIVGSIQALDGVIMAARREVLTRVKFDEVTFDGWHHYDVDFSFASYQAGFRIGVACDIAVLHNSPGIFQGAWSTYAERFARKWLPGLPQKYKQNFVWTNVPVASKADCLQIMNPPFWSQDP